MTGMRASAGAVRILSSTHSPSVSGNQQIQEHQVRRVTGTSALWPVSRQKLAPIRNPREDDRSIWQSSLTIWGSSSTTSIVRASGAVAAMALSKLSRLVGLGRYSAIPRVRANRLPLGIGHASSRWPCLANSKADACQSASCSDLGRSVTIA